MGVPLRIPVVVLNVIPAGADGEIAKLAIAPPPEVELIEYPTIAVPAVLVSAVEERVNAGAASAGAEVADAAGGTYAGVVTGIDAADAGEVPSAVVAVIVNV